MGEQVFVYEERENHINQIVREYGDSILRLCLLYLHDYHLAEDAAQDSLIKIYKNLDRFRGDCSEKTWIMRIVANTCKDYCRSFWVKRVDRGLPQNGREPFLTFDEAQRLAGSQSEVLEAVSALPRPLREVVLLRYYQEMTIAEIAQALHLSASAVHHRLKKAKEKLKPALWEEYFNE